MKLKNILQIAKKEVKSYMDNPSSYVALIIVMLVWEFLFFRNFFLIGEASLRGLFELMPWLLLVFIAAITMGSFSREKEDGTLELLFTHPVTETQVVFGKFLSSLCFVGFTLLLTLPVAIFSSKYGTFDWGIYASQLIGALLFSSAVISLGLFISSLFSGQIVSLLLTVGAGFLLILSGTETVTISLPSSLALAAENLSLLGHFQAVSRGAVDLRDVWYFVSFIVLFLGLTNLQFLKTKYGVNKVKYLSYQTGMLLFIGIMVLSNILGNRIQGRLDFTRNKVYTLSRTTKNVLNNVDDLVEITLYVSKEMPAQYGPIVREVKDLLHDYKANSKGNIEFEIKDPSSDDTTAQEAMSKGIQQIQFNVIGQEELQLKNGFLGLAITYGGSSEAIPFIQNINDLEYQITSLLKKLTTKDKKTVAFLEGIGTKTILTDYRYLNAELSKLYNVTTISPDPDSKELKGEFDTLVIPGPTAEAASETSKSIETALSNGKNVIFMIDSNIIDIQALTVAMNLNSLSGFVEQYGVKVNKDMVYDLRANQTIRTGDGVVSFLMPYPLWIRSFTESADVSPITARQLNVDMPWASTLTVNNDTLAQKGYNAIPLLVTSDYAGVITGTYTLDPSQTFSDQNLGSRTLAVALNPTGEAPQSMKGKIVVIGDSDFTTDAFVQQAAQNLSFAVNAISWLTEGDVYADIKEKERFGGAMVFQDSSQASIFKYTCFAIAAGIPLIIGAFRYIRRYRLKNISYES